MLIAASLLASALVAAPPIAQHPVNPHYFLFRGEPTILVTSGEHYGAVLNLDFDFIPYLDELQARGFNLTRTFAGTYREVPGSFKIRSNTLAPAPGRFLAPWPRTEIPGAADGGNMFDLDGRDEAYYGRLKTFCAEAGRRGIVVELVLFCPLYQDELWEMNPMHPRNNVQGLGPIPRLEALSLKHPALLDRQLAFVREVVAAVREVDNLFFEVCNEPYTREVPGDWEDAVIAAIVEAEAGRPDRHLIARNIANGSARVERPNPAVSILNFHYARPPEAVAVNFGLNRVIGDDETGFKGVADRPYRSEAWEFLLAGGGLFDNLDYSFTVEHPDGSAEVVAPTPGGGGPALRSQLATLKRFVEGFDFVRMAPAPEIVRGGLPDGVPARVLAEPGRAYALYLSGGGQADLRLDLPADRFRIDWIDPGTGAVVGSRSLDHPGGVATLASPRFEEDLALRIVAD